MEITFHSFLTKKLQLIHEGENEWQRNVRS
jgi:hypothetical protein